MQGLRWALSCLATAGLIKSSFAGPLGHKEAMPEIFVKATKALSDGAKGETISEFYARMNPHLTDDANFQLEPFLKDHGNDPAPAVATDGNEVTFSRGKYKLTLKYERDAKGLTVMHANGQLLTEEDHKSVANLFSKLEKIIRESGHKQAGLFSRLMLPEARADDPDWMYVLLGCGVGAAVGYGIGEFAFGGNGLTGALIGGAIGLAAGYFFAPRTCSSDQQCCLYNNIYQIGCCSKIGGVAVTPPMGTCPVQTAPYVVPPAQLAPAPATVPQTR